MTPDDYLWDGSGDPDPEVQALERALAPLRWQRGTRAPAVARRPWLAAAAALLFVAALGISGAALWKAWRAEGAVPDAAGAQPSSYFAEALSGSLERSELRVGDRLHTDEATRARLTIGDIGSVLVEPDSRVRIEATGVASDGASPHRLFLERGAVTASIFAAPRLFAVGTPSGLAVDMGCVYTARVEGDGSTRLSVTLGQVSFETEGRKVTVPAGASTQASPGCGPSTPVWDSAPPGYREAVAQLDRLLTAPEGGDLAGALDAVLATDREEDSLTLWHLLAWRAVPASENGRVFAALAALSPPPEGVEREACRTRDDAALERWRRSFAWVR